MRAARFIRLGASALATAAMVVAGASRALAQGCAMCGTAVTPNDPLGEALNVSVVFLMATPYVLVGGVALWLVAQYRRRLPAAPADSKEE